MQTALRLQTFQVHIVLFPLHIKYTIKSSNILEIQVDNRTICTSGDMVEAFNEHFTNIGQVLAQEGPAAEVNPKF